MTYSRLTTALFGATALGLAFTYPAAAQQQEVTEETACEALQELIDKAGQDVREEFADAADIAEMNEGRACVVYMGRVDEAGGLTLDTAEREAGEAETDQAEVEVQAEAEAEKADEQPASEQATAGETTDVKVADPDEGTAAKSTTDEPEQGTAEFKADVEPLEAEEQPTTAETKGDAEFTADVEPLEAGEETATDTAAQQEAGERAVGEQPEQRLVGTAENGQQPTAAQETDQQAEAEPGTELPVSDIAGRDVVTQDGEEVGTVDRFVMIDGTAHAVFRRGGFFGFGGDDVAIPATNLAVRGEEIVLTGFDVEGFEALPELQSDVETELAAEETVRIGTVE